jgi:hypothetical protein
MAGAGSVGLMNSSSAPLLAHGIACASTSASALSGPLLMRWKHVPVAVVVFKEKQRV